MTRFIIHCCVAVATVSSVTSLQAQPGTLQPLPTVAQDPNFHRASQLLGLPSSYCGHVMDLMMQQRMRQQTGRIGTPAIQLPHLSVQSSTGDLALRGVHEVTPATNCEGPVFQITLQNNSTVPIGNFFVTIVGVAGRIHPACPTAEQLVGRMEPGQQQCVTLQLPVTCLTMGPPHQQCAFDTLVVAVDSRDCLLENNEINNLQVLPRQTIPVLATEGQEVVPGTQPQAASPIDPAAIAPAAPVAPGGRDPLQNADLDQQQVEQPQELQLRFR